MKALSLFSGCGGMDLGLERAGITAVAHVEIDPKAQSVLRRHWPDVPVLNDVTEVTADDVGGRGSVQLVHGGSPCQDLSVAGKRAGLDGERSGLFWEQCRIADDLAPDWVLWENVAGALSSNDGADFAAVLWGLTGALPDVPDGGWRNSGVCVGPKRWATWRLLDAQFFAVPQRRRRVFVVAGAGVPCRPEVLLESEGVLGNPPPRREAGQEAAGTIGAGTPGGGSASDTERMTFVPDVTGTVTTTWAKGPGNTQVEEGHVIPVVYNQHGHAQWAEGVGTIRARDAKGDGHLVAFAENQRGEVRTSATVPLAAGSTLAVRRLTPVECEALMGWPRDWTRWADDGTEIADSHRYRLIGNGVVSTVAEWVGRRIMEAAQETDGIGRG